MSAWKVFALRAGRSLVDRSVVTYLSGMGEGLVIPHTMFLLMGQSIVVVDTSFSAVEGVKDAYPQEIWREPEEEPVALLGRLGVDASDVAMVICTHLHYDHCGSNGLFTNARAVVQSTEFEYAQHPVCPMMEREFFSPSGGFTPPYGTEQLRFVDGDTDLGSGLQVIALPGHTPGSQGVLVETSRGVLALPGDQVMVEENFSAGEPVGLHVNVDDWQRSLVKLRKMTDWVVPSYDGRIFGGGETIAEIV